MTKHHCAYCRKKLQLGMDAFRIRQGVIGPRGFVALEDGLLLCCEKCLRENFADDIPPGPARIP